MLGYSMASGAARNDWIARTTASSFYHQTLGAFPFPQYAKPLFFVLYAAGAWLTARRSPLLFATTMIFIPGGIILCAMMGLFKGVFLVRSIQTFVLLAPIWLAVVMAKLPRSLMVGGTLLLAGAGLWSARADFPEVPVANAGAGMKLAFAAPAPNRFLDADIEMELQANDISLERWQPIAIEQPGEGLARIGAKLAECRKALPTCGDTVVVIADHPPFFAAEADEWRRGIDALEKIYPAANDQVMAGYRFTRFRQD